MITPTVINRGNQYWNFELSVAEQRYKSTYIGDFCLKTRGGQWSDFPAAVFYNPKPDKPEYSNYFGLFVQNDTVIITNALVVTEGSWNGMVADNGEVVYSRYRHDFRTSTDGSVTVDGGRDYFRILGNILNPKVCVTVKEGLMLVDDKHLPFL